MKIPILIAFITLSSIAYGFETVPADFPTGFSRKDECFVTEKKPTKMQFPLDFCDGWSSPNQCCSLLHDADIKGHYAQLTSSSAECEKSKLMLLSISINKSFCNTFFFNELYLDLDMINSAANHVKLTGKGN